VSYQAIKIKWLGRTSLGVLHKMHVKEEREGKILHAFFHSTISKLFSVKAYGMGFLIGLIS
jgi:hypothetical protein